MNPIRTNTGSLPKCPTTTKRRRLPGPVGSGLILAMLQLSVFTGLGMNIVTNCTDPGSPLPAPKRLTSGCPALGLPTFMPPGAYTVGFYKLNTSLEEEYTGIARFDSTGEFVWKYALTNASIFIPVAADDPLDPVLIVQTRDLGAGPVACIGAYILGLDGNLNEAFVESQLPIDDHARVSATQLQNGMTIVALDKTNSVVLIGLDLAGQLLWAKELSSAEFPVVSVPDAPPHQMTVRRFATNDILLEVAATEMVNGTNTAKSVLVRMDSNGNLQWAKKVQVPLYLQDDNPYGDGLWLTPDGEILLVILDTQGFATQLTTVLRIDEDGNFVWGKRITGVALARGLQFTDDQGSVVLGFADFNFAANATIFGLMDSSGNLNAAVEVHFPYQGYANLSAAPEAKGRIYYCGTYSADASAGPYTGIIGSSSLALDDFAWRRYERDPVSQYDVGLQAQADGRLAYFANDADGAWADMVLIESNLTVEADCDFFSPVAFTTSSRSLAVNAVVPTVTNIAIQQIDLALSLDSADLVFEQMAFGEEELCLTNCAFTLSAGRVALQPTGGSTNVSIAPRITVINGESCAWSVVNPYPEWVTVTPPNDVGSTEITISAGANTTGIARYCQLTIGEEPLLISQVAITSGTQPQPFRLIASSTANLIELQTNPVTEIVITNGYDYSFYALDAAADGRLYGFNSDDAWLINPVTGDIQQLGSLQTTNGTAVRPDSIAFSPGGVLYAFDILDDSLYTVDTNTWTATLVGQNTSDVPVSSIEFAPDGRLLGAYFDLSEMDPATGQVISTIGSFPLLTFVTGITFAPDGFIYGVNSNFKKLYRINPDTAAVQTLGTFQSWLESIAWVPVTDTSPVVIVTDGSLGFSGGDFGFNVTGSEGQVVVFEVSTNLVTWTPVLTNTLGAGSFYFSDPDSSATGMRFYRLRLQ